MEPRARKPTLDELALADIQAEEDKATIAMLTKRAELDATEARYRKLAAVYGGNRRARRRARAEVRKKR